MTHELLWGTVPVPDWIEDIRFWVRLDAGRTVTGNPKRAIVIFRAESCPVAIQEGFEGAPGWLRKLPGGIRFQVTSVEYRYWVDRESGGKK